jgi:hypothetical protein
MVNYDKWNKLDDYSSDEDAVAPRKMKPSFSMKSQQNGTLVTIPWDPYCGMFLLPWCYED